jgi:hypothetical protein
MGNEVWLTLPSPDLILAQGGTSWTVNWLQFDNSYFRNLLSSNPDEDLLLLGLAYALPSLSLSLDLSPSSAPSLSLSVCLSSVSRLSLVCLSYSLQRRTRLWSRTPPSRYLWSSTLRTKRSSSEITRRLIGSSLSWDLIFFPQRREWRSWSSRLLRGGWAERVRQLISSLIPSTSVLQEINHSQPPCRSTKNSLPPLPLHQSEERAASCWKTGEEKGRGSSGGSDAVERRLEE